MYTDNFMAKSKFQKKKNTGIKLIKKANKLVESRYKFDIWETRIFLSVLAQVNRDDEDFKVYRIYYKDVIKNFNLRSSQSYGFLRDAARMIMRKVFNVTDYAEGHERETEYHIIRTVNYATEGQKMDASKEFIDITIDPEMKPLLLQLGHNYKEGVLTKGEGFTAYDMRNIEKLGAYHVRIYELLKQYQKIKWRQLEVEELKRMFELTTEYPLFANFFQKIIKPAHDKINKYTDLTITKLEKVKTGRRITSLRFEFRSKTAEELAKIRGESIQTKLNFKKEDSVKESEVEALNLNETENDKLFDYFLPDVVQRFGVTPSVFMKLLKKYNKDQIEQAVRVTNRANYQQQIKSNIAGFFIKALKQGYTDPKEETEKKKQRIAEKRLKDTETRAKLQKLKIEKTSKINKVIKKLTSKNPELTEQAVEALRDSAMAKLIIEKQETTLGRMLTIEDYRKDSMLRELVKGKIMELKPNDFSKINGLYEQKAQELKRLLK
jgi:plasmid replication initiation protein